jgi:Ca2+:H+ antiporter
MTSPATRVSETPTTPAQPPSPLRTKEANAYPIHRDSLPSHNNVQRQGTWGSKTLKHIRPAGESGRRGLDPLHFLRICLRSSCYMSMWVNILWPFVPVAFAVVSIVPCVS